MPPPYGQGGGYPAAQPKRNNGFAIASFVCSLVGILCCAIPSVVGIILGFIALSQIKKTGQDGSGMALAGVIIGFVVLAGWTLLMIIGMVTDNSTTYYSS